MKKQCYNKNFSIGNPETHLFTSGNEVTSHWLRSFFKKKYENVALEENYHDFADR